MLGACCISKQKGKKDFIITFKFSLKKKMDFFHNLRASPNHALHSITKKSKVYCHTVILVNTWKAQMYNRAIVNYPTV
jgi:hypothetical protein